MGVVEAIVLTQAMMLCGSLLVTGRSKDTGSTPRTQVVVESKRSWRWASGNDAKVRALVL